ncbi:MAG: AMP-binding protein [Pirellulaceae bacterium]
MNVAQLAVDALDRFGEYKSTYFEEQWYTNVELMRRWCALATVLQGKGVRPGDRVVVMMPSCLEVPAAFHAVARIGAVIIPLMPQLIAREVKFIVEDSGARTMITSPEIAPCVVEATSANAESCRILVCGETELPNCENILPLVQTAAPMESMSDAEPNDLAVLVYTSGTTGRPKGVMLSHANLISNTESVAELFDLPADERSMMVLPMSHVYGILLMNLSALNGGVSTMLRRFDTELALQTLADFCVERCSLVPAMQVALIHHPNRENYDYSSLKIVAAGSAPLAEEIRVDFERLFDCRVVDGYGQSEATCAVSAYRDDEAFVVGSVGRPIPGVEVCIQNDENHPLPFGETGEICIRGPNVMLGYWNNEEASRAAIIDGWLHSGDIGHTNKQGYIFITDRKKDMIIKAGENISPREIEEAIYGLAGVSEVSVYGVPDPALQEEIAVSIVMKAGEQVSADDVREFAGGCLSKFKIPKYVMFPDQLPKNSNGKVLKRTLREEWKSASDLS